MRWKFATKQIPRNFLFLTYFSVASHRSLACALPLRQIVCHSANWRLSRNIHSSSDLIIFRIESCWLAGEHSKMNRFILMALLCSCLVQNDLAVTATTIDDGTQKMPTVMFVMLFRNKGHTMPYVLSYLNRLDYPKDRISFWWVFADRFIAFHWANETLSRISGRIRSDHNEDNTLDVLINWLASTANEYHNVNTEYDKEKKHRSSESSPTHWPQERHLDLIRLKEEGLEYARASWADYVFVRKHFIFLIFIIFTIFLVKRSDVSECAGFQNSF